MDRKKGVQEDLGSAVKPAVTHQLLKANWVGILDLVLVLDVALLIFGL
jgi:hypothetical protein